MRYGEAVKRRNGNLSGSPAPDLMIVCLQTGCFAPGCKRNDQGTVVPLSLRPMAENPSHPDLRPGWSLTPCPL